MKLTATSIMGGEFEFKVEELPTLLNEISNIRLIHESFELGLEINDNKLKVIIIRTDEGFKTLKYKNKFKIIIAEGWTEINQDNLLIGKTSYATYTFKSQKQLLKLLRRLTQCK